MFHDSWRSRRNRIMQALCSAWFTLCAAFRSKGNIVIHGENFGALRGEITIETGDVYRAASEVARKGQVFLLAPISQHGSIQDISTACGLDAGKPIHAFLSINALVVLFATRQSQPVVLHVAQQLHARVALERHHQGLTVARACAGVTPLAGLIPECLHRGDAGGYGLLVQSRQPGASLSFARLDPDDIWRALMSGLHTAAALGAQGTACDDGPDCTFIHEELPRVLARWPQLAPQLRPLLLALQDWQHRQPHTGVLVHGDYWLGNLLFNPTTFDVTGVVDWENARAHGMPGFDALYFGLLTLAMGRGCSVAVLIAQVVRGIYDDPLLALYIAQVQSTLKLDATTTAYLALLIYFTLLHKLSLADDASFNAKQFTMLTAQLPMWTSWAAEHQGPLRATA